MNKSSKSSLKYVLAVVILLIFFHYLGFLNFLEQGVIKVLLPVQETFYNWGSSISKIVHLNEISKENQKLREEIARLSVDYVQLANLEAQNNYFRSELDYLQNENFEFKLAQVIGRLPLNNQILIINQGHLNGLKEGLAVTVSEGIVVGKILSVEENRAYVELLTNTQSSLAVSLSNLSGTSGLIKGKAGNSLSMEFIPQSEFIEVGDMVISSGLEELIPRGLLVGEVSEVTSQVGQIFKQAKVIPPFSYQNLQTLTVIISY